MTSHIKFKMQKDERGLSPLNNLQSLMKHEKASPCGNRRNQKVWEPSCWSTQIIQESGFVESWEALL